MEKHNKTLRQIGRPALYAVMHKYVSPLQKKVVKRCKAAPEIVDSEFHPPFVAARAVDDARLRVRGTGRG